jgi:energy-coupling factor transporter ATP-binding protein EcfA2
LSASQQSQLTDALFAHHLLIVGQTGSGKTTTTLSLLSQLQQQNETAIILDPTGEYAKLPNTITYRFGDNAYFEAGKLSATQLLRALQLPVDPVILQKLRQAITDLQLQHNVINQPGVYHRRNRAIRDHQRALRQLGDWASDYRLPDLFDQLIEEFVVPRTDAQADYALLGQVVIAALMEIGGLGFMTFAVMMSLMIRRRRRMSTRLLTQEALNLDHLSQLSVVYLIIRLSILIQLIGSVFLFFDFYPKYGLTRAIWYSLFHAISAFCNAGFDLFGNSMDMIDPGRFLWFPGLEGHLGLPQVPPLIPAHPAGPAHRGGPDDHLSHRLLFDRAQPGPAQWAALGAATLSQHDFHGDYAADRGTDHLSL